MFKSSFSPNKAKVFLYTLQITFLLICCIEILIFLVSTFFSLLWYALSPRSISRLHVQEHSHFSYPWNSLVFLFAIFFVLFNKIKNGSVDSHPASGYMSKRVKIRISKRYLYPHVHWSIIHKSQGTETTQTTDELIQKIWYIHTVEYYSALKKEILPYVTTWMNLKDIMWSEINRVQKDTYCVIPLLCGIWNSHTHRSRVEWWLWGAGRDITQGV